MEWKNKVCIVTGASSGMGEAFAVRLARKGVVVVLVARREKELLRVLREVQQYSLESMVIVADVTKQKDVQAIAEQVMKKFQRIDMVVNCAGFGLYKSVAETSLEEFRSMMEVNYFGTVMMTKAVLPVMQRQRSGVIMNIASVAGKGAFPRVSGYAASKFAVAGFTEGLYYDVYDEGIQVLLVCPGAVNTHFFDHPSFKKFPHASRHKGMVEPEAVVNATLNAIQKKKFEIFVPASWRLKYWGRVLLPRLFMWRVRKLPRE